jgi:hypothetical protein
VTRGPAITDRCASYLSSRKPDLITNSDGSVDIYIALTQPDGKKNWIKTAPGKGWFAYFRFYMLRWAGHFGFLSRAVASSRI